MKDATASSATQEPNQKKQKIKLIEASVRTIQEQFLRLHLPVGEGLHKRNKFQMLIRDLDKSRTREFNNKCEEWMQQSPAGPRTGKVKGHLAEVYSLPRMVEAARRIGMEAGFALDLTNVDEEGNQWDLSKTKMRTKALQLLDEKKPVILIVNPPCTMLSSLQQLNIAKMKDETKPVRQTRWRISHSL